MGTRIQRKNSISYENRFHFWLTKKISPFTWKQIIVMIEYVKVTFELKPIYKQGEYGNVIHFWAGGDTNPTCGERMPNISKNRDLSKGLTFQTCANGVSTNRYETGGHGDGLIIMDWSQVEVGQRNMEGQYQYYIKIRGTEVFTVNNNSPVSLTNVHAFIGTPFDGPPWYRPQSIYYTDIEMRNIQGKVNSIAAVTNTVLN